MDRKPPKEGHGDKKLAHETLHGVCNVFVGFVRLFYRFSLYLRTVGRRQRYLELFGYLYKYIHVFIYIYEAINIYMYVYTCEDIFPPRPSLPLPCPRTSWHLQFLLHVPVNQEKVLRITLFDSSHPPGDEGFQSTLGSWRHTVTHVKQNTSPQATSNEQAMWKPDATSTENKRSKR